MINLESLGERIAGQWFTWDADDASLYALSVGASLDGVSEQQFSVADGREDAEVLPTFVLILTTRAVSDLLSNMGDFPLSAVIHAGQSVELNRPVPVHGSGIGSAEVTGIFDTGTHALIETMTELRFAPDEEPFARTRSTILVLHAGGFGGDGPPARPVVPDLPPEGSIRFDTVSSQGLLYRLNGDRNPLHYSTEAATSVGYPGPILHGLCSLGIVSRQLLNSFGDGNAQRFERISCRFSKPVFPGEQLNTEWWDQGGVIRFRTKVGERVVLDDGVFAVRGSKLDD